ncbi:acetoacetate decarboxylase family protein [Thermodesulfobacteriota bacterium]
MLYSLTRKDLDKLAKIHFLADFPNAEMLVATFKTDPDVAKKILPKPLTLSPDNLATAFVARYPETNFGCVYNEGALFLISEYRGEKGFYCLSMPVDDDMAMIGGRENFGYPKKMADKITLENNADSVIGSVMRKGTEILRIECRLGGDAPDDYMRNLGYPTKDWDGIPCHKIVSFLFKYFPSAGGDSFDYFPRLIREPVLFRPIGKPRTGTGTVNLKSTVFDPLGDIAVGPLKNIFYGRFHNTMLPGKVVSRVWNPLKFAKHAFFKNDYLPTLLENFDPRRSERAKQILQAARKY